MAGGLRLHRHLGSLGGRITHQLIVLFVGLSLLLTTIATTMFARAVLQDTHTELEAAVTLDWQSVAWNRSAAQPSPTASPSPGTPTPSPTPRMRNAGIRIGMPVGSLSVVSRDNVTSAVRLSPNGTLEQLDDEVVGSLLEVARDGAPHDILIPQLGSMYRVIAVDSEQDLRGLRTPETPANRVVIEAVPLRPLRVKLLGGILGALALIAAGAAMAAIGIRRTISKAVEPLAELAHSANGVAATQLSAGTADLRTLRVQPGHYQDEIAEVSTAFNKMLGHVEDALSQREQSEQTLRQFVADASHELRNPLASIRGYAEITAKHGAHLPAETQFAIQRIDAESRRMARLVEDLLLLARLDSEPSLELGEVDLSEMLIHAVSDNRAAGPEHSWKLCLPTEPVTIRADHQRLYQVIINLLANARVHTPAGTCVQTTLTPADDRVIITVSDDGPGIPEHLRSQVFERFTRGDSSRANRGQGSTGLGLAIAYSVVAAHQGTISVSSEQGTTFRIELPVAGPQG